MATRIEQIPFHVMPGGAQLIHAAECEKNACVALIAQALAAFVWHCHYRRVWASFLPALLDLQQSRRDSRFSFLSLPSISR